MLYINEYTSFSELDAVDAHCQSTPTSRLDSNKNNPVILPGSDNQLLFKLSFDTFFIY